PPSYTTLFRSAKPRPAAEGERGRDRHVADLERYVAARQAIPVVAARGARGRLEDLCDGIPGSNRGLRRGGRSDGDQEGRGQEQGWRVHDGLRFDDGGKEPLHK